MMTPFKPLRVPLVAILLFAGGCDSLDVVRTGIATKGAEAYDQALTDAIWVKCKAASVGSVERRYMQTAEGWAIWTQECLTSGARDLPDLGQPVPSQ